MHATSSPCICWWAKNLISSIGSSTLSSAMPYPWRSVTSVLLRSMVPTPRQTLLSIRPAAFLWAQGWWWWWRMPTNSRILRSCQSTCRIPNLLRFWCLWTRMATLTAARNLWVGLLPLAWFLNLKRWRSHSSAELSQRSSARRVLLLTWNRWALSPIL